MMLMHNFRFVLQDDQPDNTTKREQQAHNSIVQADHWRINVYCTLLDTVARQLQDLFHDDTIGIFEEMEHFTPKKLMTMEEVAKDKIANLCNVYDGPTSCDN